MNYMGSELSSNITNLATLSPLSLKFGSFGNMEGLFFRPIVRDVVGKEYENIDLVRISQGN
jgi:hypothetical protein